MKTTEPTIILQSSTTGRILLVQNKTWGFLQAPGQGNTLMPLLNIVYEITGADILCEDDDVLSNFALTWVSSRYFGSLFHVWIEDEPQYENSEWFDLFSFPDHCDPLVLKMLEEDSIMQVLTSIPY